MPTQRHSQDYDDRNRSERYGSEGRYREESYGRGGRESDERSMYRDDTSRFGNRDRGNRGRQVEYDPEARFDSVDQRMSQSDDDYANWRDEQMNKLDTDYQEWRKERRKKFVEEFDKWRSDRATKGAAQTESTSKK